MLTAVLGLGLIGGSLLRGLGHQAVGYDVDPAVRSLARESGCRVARTLAEAVSDAQVIVLATPLGAVPEVLRELAHTARPGPVLTDSPVLTDVVSVKAPVAAAVRTARLPLRYVGGHPMAGTEHSGFAASDPRLFDGAVWVLCVEDDTDLTAWLRLAELVTGLGTRVVPCPASTHDLAVARVSALPHVLAATLAGAAGDGGALPLALAAGSFRDGTRVAGTRPELSAALCEGNRSALADVLDDQLRRLTDVRDRLRSGDGLGELFAAGRASRQRWTGLADSGALSELDADDPALRDHLVELGSRGGHVTGVSAHRIGCWHPL